MVKSFYSFLRCGLLCLAGAAIAQTARAEFRYTFTQTTATYTALSSPTSLNGSTIWDDDQFTASIPFTWVLDSAHTMTDVPVDLSLPAILHDLTNFSTSTGFIFGFADFVDRGDGGPTSLSPISYQTTGTAPNRIFKLEFQNAGFYDDPSLNEYVNFQVWIYETSNIVEMHFGSSSVSQFDNYSLLGNGPVFGMIQDADLDNGTSGMIYYLDGTGSTTTVDSLQLPPPSTFPSNTLTAWPSSGTVFRFTPKWSACARPAAAFTAANQSALAVRFTFTGATSGLDSLVWNFGDGQRQKVTTGFTTPVNHTYMTAGAYSATVTSYNSCGSTTATARQVRVAVADIPGLSNVRVYPNVTDNNVVVEGLNPGATLLIFNSMGQQVRRLSVTDSKQSISLGGLAAGNYLLRMQDKNGSQGTAQVIKR